MGTTRQEAIERLSAAIRRWGADPDAAHAQLAADPERTRQLLEAILGALESAGNGHAPAEPAHDGRVAQLESTVAALRAELTALRGAGEELRDTVAQLRDELATARDDLAATRDELAQSRSEADTLRERLIESESAPHEVRRVLAETEAELSHCRNHAHKADESAREMAGEVLALRNQLEEAEARAARADTLEYQLNDVQQRYEQTLTEEQADHAHAAWQLARLRKEVEADREAMEEMRAEMEMMRRANESLSRALCRTEGRRPTGELVPYGDDGRKRKLGEMLVEAGYLSQEQLRIALDEQTLLRQTRLGTILVGRGFVDQQIISRGITLQLETDSTLPSQ